MGKTTLFIGNLTIAAFSFGIFASANIDNTRLSSCLLSEVEALADCEASKTCTNGTTISCSASGITESCNSGIENGQYFVRCEGAGGTSHQTCI